MSAETIAVTFFSDFGASAKREQTTTSEQLAELIRETTAAEKGRLPWLKLARFGERPTEKGSLRWDGNLIACSGIEADYDAEHLSFDEAVEILEKAGVEGIVYTSPSATMFRHRWRVLCWFSVELPPAERDHMMGRLNGLFKGVFATESWTLSQSYYFGSVSNNPAHRVTVVEGMTTIDQCHELDEIWLGKPNGAGTKPNGHDHSGGPVDEASLIAAIISGENYHEAKIRLLGKWAHDGVSFMEAERRLFEAFDAVDVSLRDARWTERRSDIPRTVDGIYGKDARKQDNADAEFAAIQQAISELPRDCDSKQVLKLIGRIVLAALPALVEDKLVSDISRITGERRTILSATIKEVKKKLKAEARSKTAVASGGWQHRLKVFETSGEIKPTMANVAIVIRNAAEFQGTVWLDDFTGQVYLRKPLPGEDSGSFRERAWSDVDELTVTEWIQDRYDISVQKNVVFDGVLRVANEHHFHQVLEYLHGPLCQWDGVVRLPGFLKNYWGAHDAPDEYLAAIGTRGFLQAVARVHRAGIKADCIWLIDGEQGKRKSTGLRMIGDPIDRGWFADELGGELGTKDGSIGLRGKWWIEFSELSALRRSESERTKGYLSRATDHYRLPYDRHSSDIPRQNTFAGTSNDDEVLKDPTGNRRYWPFKSGEIDTKKIWQDRHQLWAEAVYRFDAGEKWHIDEPELIAIAEGEQAKYRETDVWENPIAEHLESVTTKLGLDIATAHDRNFTIETRKDYVERANVGVTTAGILTGVLYKKIGDVTNADQQRVGKTLRALGWRREQLRKGELRGVMQYLP